MLTGRCLCGDVAFEVTTAPLRMVFCHCLQCRRSSGSSFATVVVVERDGFRLTRGADTIGTYESRPGKLRHHCPRCGSPVYNEMRDGSGALSVRAGAFEQDPGVRPSAHIWLDSKAPWITIDDDLARHREAFGSPAP